MLTLESERLKSEISSRQELLSRIDAETNLVEEVIVSYFIIYLVQNSIPMVLFMVVKGLRWSCLKDMLVFATPLLSTLNKKKTSFQERAKAEKINRKLRGSLADFRVPNVMEYVGEKADLYELQKKVKSWERKVEIAEVGFSFYLILFIQLSNMLLSRCDSELGVKTCVKLDITFVTELHREDDTFLQHRGCS